MAATTIDINDIEELQKNKVALENNGADKRVILLIDILISMKTHNFDECCRLINSWFLREDILEDHSRIILTAISQIKQEEDLRFLIVKTRNLLLRNLLEKKSLMNVPKFFYSIGFNKNSSEEKISILADELVTHALTKAFSLKLVDVGLYLEHLYYQEFVTRFETDEAFKYGMKQISNAIESSGNELFRKFNPLGLDEFEHYDNAVPIVGFFFHNASMLAHINNVFGFLKNLTEKSDLEFEPIIFCLGGRHSAFSEAFSSIGVEIVYLDEDRDGKPIILTSKRLLRLREICLARQVDKLVWGCLSTYMLFTFSLKVAPEQIWWSQKWTGLSSSTIQKSIYSITPKLKQQINGDQWLGGWFQKESWLSDVDSKKLQESKKPFEGKVILGTLARVQKINDVRFLAVLAKILKSNENVVFLWTGREEDKFVDDFFIKNGVKQKTKFVGWVDTSLYAHIIDILLDSFPSGNGVTAIQAMEAKVPVVTRKSCGDIRTWDQFIGPSTEKGSIYQRQVLEAFSIQNGKRGLYHCAHSDEEYIAMANLLIRDPLLRKKSGEAGEKFVNLMMKNPSESSKIFQKHILS